MWQTFGGCYDYTTEGNLLLFSLNIPLNEEWELVRLRTHVWTLVLGYVVLSVNRDKRISVIPSLGSDKLTIGDKIKGGSNITLRYEKHTADHTTLGYYIDVIRRGIKS